MSSKRAFSDVPIGVLKSVAHKLLAQEISWPPITAQFQAAGWQIHLPEFQGFAGLDATAMTSLLGAIIAEREHYSGQDVTLVWTGDEANAAQTRNTRVVIGELFKNANAEILVAGYRFDNCEDLFKPVFEKLALHQVRVTIFFDIPRLEGNLSVEQHIKNYREEFLRQNWPFGEPYPDFYYYPGTIRGREFKSMHAKCAVIDEEICLIGSANFTSRGMTRNIEIGVLIERPKFAKKVQAHWVNLINMGIVQKVA